MKPPRSRTHGGRLCCGTSPQSRPATASCAASTRFSWMFGKTRHDSFAEGFAQTSPVHPVSCHGTRIDTCWAGSVKARGSYDDAQCATTLQHGCQELASDLDRVLMSDSLVPKNLVRWHQA